MDTEVLTQFAQFGTAGLMAWMWLSERRGALTREKELSEAHAKVMEQRVQVDALLAVVKENTAACAALEAGQRAIAAAVERIAARLAPPGAPPEAPIGPRAVSAAWRGAQPGRGEGEAGLGTLSA